MSIYENLRTDNQYKASIGLKKEEFDALFSIFETLYVPKSFSPYKEVNAPVLTNKREALFFILHYLKSYPTLQNMGLYFGFSSFTASEYIELLKPILKKSLSIMGMTTIRVFKDQESFDKAFEGVEDIYIDVTEIPVERPDNQELQKAKYSGKKKAHTIKWLIICDKFKRIYYLSEAFSGSIHDFTIFKTVLGHINFNKIRIWVDLGFVGIKNEIQYKEIFIPYKSSKNHQLTRDEISINKKISSQRIVIENSIAGLKRQFVLRIKNRMRKSEKLDCLVEISNNLWSFLIKMRQPECVLTC